MAIGVLTEALPGGRGSVAGGEPPPKDEAGLAEWIRSKLKALASLLGKLVMKAAEALPGIIGGIISWVVNRAKDVVGLGIAKLKGFGCRYRRIDIYLYGNQKVITL